MEKHEHSDIVNTTIDYYFDKDNLEARAVHASDHKRYFIEVTKILGVEVAWHLQPFMIVDIYEYFENQVMDDIYDNLINKKIRDYYTKHQDLIVWLTDEAYNSLHEEMIDFVTNTLPIDWSIFFNKIVNEMAKNGYLSSGLYHHVVAGYFESVAKRLFEIDVAKAKYSKVDGVGNTTVTFWNDAAVSARSDFFTENQFFNELTRLTTTDNFLTDLRINTGVLLCNQLIYTER